MNEKVIFCANCQADVSHTLFKSSYSGEIIATCTECSRTLKFPPEMTTKAFDGLVEAHKADNEGQVVVAPGGVGPADVYVAPGAPAEPAQELDEPEAVPEVPEPQNVGTPDSPEQREAALAEGGGERAQENLTPAEREAWEQFKKSSAEGDLVPGWLASDAAVTQHHEIAKQGSHDASSAGEPQLPDEEKPQNALN